jgi:sortase A
MRRLLPRLRSPLVVVASVAVSVAAAYPISGEVAEVPTPEPVAPTPAPVSVFTPEAMEIPKIGVSAPTTVVWTEPSGRMGSPTNGVDIGWWGGRRPGEGNALFAAHFDWQGSPGSFYQLKDLEPGDEVIVTGEGQSQTYRVDWVQIVHRKVETGEILGNTEGRNEITLITCEGFFDRNIGGREDRVVARATLVST